MSLRSSSQQPLVRLPVTSPHGNFATVTLPQKLRRMVTSPHFEKVKGDVWG